MNEENSAQNNQLILAIGNSRLHWAWFEDNKIAETWNTKHLSKAVRNNCLPLSFLYNRLIRRKLTNIPIKIASVVPQQTKLWSNYQKHSIINLSDIKLKNIYPTMGIDRALAAWGGGRLYGYPCLIIDGGTALTFTGVDRNKTLIGGAILPGLRSQITTLRQKTAALPEIDLPDKLPSRWALNTNEAIASGILYTAIAGIHSYIDDWQRQHSPSQIILTGGDAGIITQYLCQQYPDLQIACDRNLIFWGMHFI